ncbi:FAD-dependent oxidoreductase [Streptomyces sp. NPDC048290]|uniref:FAD-dependent oxidoreductase n=1 Tax=Streptomyces sp. NPDC048290 TaxID=3155811 RepID=UPI003436C1EC
MTGQERDDVIVVGGGVIGLTTAVVLAERGRDVRLWTRDAAERTTSAVAGALWWPYRIEPAESVHAWALRSLTVYQELAERGPETGVRMVEGVLAETDPDEVRGWAGDRLAVRASREREYAGGPGMWARLPLIDMRTHLGWLRERLRAAGGTVQERSVSPGFPEADAPVVVNCTGLAARELVPDPAVRPVRGQLVVVANPGLETWVVAADSGATDSTYFFPHGDRLVLGGTAEDGEWSTAPDPAVAAAIVRRCAELRPEIAGARVLEHRVGLRPARDAVRLAAEREPGGRLLVHNYGHGGAGVTVAWGCAEEAAGWCGA